MTTTVTIKSERDVLAVVPHMLGFMPEDSLVIAGIGSNTPTARIDLGPVDETIGALAPAMPHWIGQTVLVVVYGDAPEGYLGSMQDALTEAGVTVAVAIATPNGGEVLGTGVPRMDAKRVRASRDELVREAAEVQDVAEAELMASESYAVGDGAKAWAYLDRAVALSGGTASAAMRDLDSKLSNAVNPRG